MVIVLAGVGGGAGYFYKTRVKQGGGSAQTESEHIVLVKDDQLQEVTKDLTRNVGRLYREFQQLVEEVAASSQGSTILASVKRHRSHNRWQDIVPYDKSIITLQRPFGENNTMLISLYSHF